jgi:hypothetical protein
VISISAYINFLLFIHGAILFRIVGFEELGNIDTFTTATLEFRLSQSGKVRSIILYKQIEFIFKYNFFVIGVITKCEPPKKEEHKTILGFAEGNDNDDDDDWD